MTAVNSAGPFSVFDDRSRRCCGRSRSGPPAEPAGNERMASATSASDTVQGEKSRGSGMTALSPGAVGCRSRSASTVSLQSGASLSSELKMRMAALMFPSSIFDMTAAASAASLSFGLLVRVSFEERMTSVIERFLNSDAVLCLRPDR